MQLFIHGASHRFQSGFIVSADLFQAGLDAGPQSFQSVVLGFAELFHAAGQRFREVVLSAGELFAMAAVLVFKAFGEAADVLVQFHPLFGIEASQLRSEAQILFPDLFAEAFETGGHALKPLAESVFWPGPSQQH